MTITNALKVSSRIRRRSWIPGHAPFVFEGQNTYQLSREHLLATDWLPVLPTDVVWSRALAKRLGIKQERVQKALQGFKKDLEVIITGR